MCTPTPQRMPTNSPIQRQTASCSSLDNLRSTQRTMPTMATTEKAAMRANSRTVSATNLGRRFRFRSSLMPSLQRWGVTTALATAAAQQLQHRQVHARCTFVWPAIPQCGRNSTRGRIRAYFESPRAGGTNLGGRGEPSSGVASWTKVAVWRGSSAPRGKRIVCRDQAPPRVAAIGSGRLSPADCSQPAGTTANRSSRKSLPTASPRAALDLPKADIAATAGAMSSQATSTILFWSRRSCRHPSGRTWAIGQEVIGCRGNYLR
jgi:hypothetical protein